MRTVCRGTLFEESRNHLGSATRKLLIGALPEEWNGLILLRLANKLLNDADQLVTESHTHGYMLAFTYSKAASSHQLLARSRERLAVVSGLVTWADEVPPIVTETDRLYEKEMESSILAKGTLQDVP